MDTLESWRVRALVVLSEGHCPEHHTPLRPSGWCVPCQCWWSITGNRDTVTTNYPFPGDREPEP